MDYKNKYLKYKIKYLKLKGGSSFTENNNLLKIDPNNISNIFEKLESPVAKKPFERLN